MVGRVRKYTAMPKKAIMPEKYKHIIILRHYALNFKETVFHAGRCTNQLCVVMYLETSFMKAYTQTVQNHTMNHTSSFEEHTLKQLALKIY